MPLAGEQQSSTLAVADTTFVYDAVGNRTLLIDGGARTTYTYDAANQLITENSGTVMTYTFDGDGNLSGRLDAGLPSLTMTWDYEDRMTAFTLSDVPLTYTADYDPDYRRVRHRIIAPGLDVTTRSLWDQENVLATMNDSAAIEKLFTYEPALYGNLISQRQGSSSYYFHFDGLGSTSQITDALQAIQNTYIYRAFGDTANSTGSIDTPFRFVGQQGYASDLDFLPYVRHRYLATTLGRWVSRDPLGMKGSPVNLYLYADGHPTLLVDPSGLLSSCEVSRCLWEHNVDECLGANECKTIAVTLASTSGLPGKSGGKQDAFRHCIWLCCMASKMGPLVAVDIGKIHEICVPGPDAHHAMDAHNNTIGAEIGAKICKTELVPKCKESCMKHLEDGSLTHLT